MICRCGHEESLHHHAKDCTYSDPATGKFCQCGKFKGETMKKNKSVKAEKPKSPRKPRAKKANGKPAAEPVERETQETSTEATAS